MKHLDYDFFNKIIIKQLKSNFNIKQESYYYLDAYLYISPSLRDLFLYSAKEILSFSNKSYDSSDACFNYGRESKYLLYNSAVRFSLLIYSSLSIKISLDFYLSLCYYNHIITKIPIQLIYDKIEYK